MRVPWTARRSNQSILKEISLECSLEGLMLRLKRQSFGHLMRRADSFEKTLILGKSDRCYFKGSKITADGDCSYEIKRHLLLGRKIMTNLDSILKSRNITLQTMVHLVKAMCFPVVMYGCESWTVKKAECQRIDAFELWCWTLESPLDCREIQPVHPEGNQS